MTLSRATRRSTVLALLLLAGALAGCDWMGVSGEGELRAAVVGPGEPFGSAVLLVTGEGALDVVGEAGTRAWAAPAGEGRLRAVLVQSEPSGTINFRIRVRDRSERPPALELVQLGDLDDERVQITPEHRILLGR